MKATTGSSHEGSPGIPGDGSVFAVLLMAGRSVRFGRDKLYEPLAGRPLWRHSYDVLAACPAVGGIGLVVSEEKVEEVRGQVEASFVVSGGRTRQESGRIGLEWTPVEYEYVTVHDAARPFIDAELVGRVVEGAMRTGASFASVPCVDTVHLSQEGRLSLLDRSSLVVAQTPQAAHRTWFLEAYRQAPDGATDEVSMLVSAGYPVEPVLGSLGNIKVTHEQDLTRSPVETRTGFGYDVHRFSADPGRPLWLGGIEFDDRPGLEGHSDADPVIHAIVDAILGAACMGDIGVHFPPSDPQWKDCRSAVFLMHAVGMVEREGWRVVHVDATVVAERPRVMARSEEIVAVIAFAAGLKPGQVSMKATTAEGLGSIGAGEGVAAYAVATLTRVAVV